VSLRHAWSPLGEGEQESSGAVIWETCGAGVSSAQGVGFLAGWWVQLSHTSMVPVPAGQGSSHSTWSWNQAGPDGRGEGPVVPHVTGAQQGLKGSGLVWGGSAMSCGTSSSWGLAQTCGRFPGGRGFRGTAEGPVFRHGVGLGGGWRPVWPRDGYPAMCESRTEVWPGAA
jgi:hypothetical protein